MSRTVSLDSIVSPKENARSSGWAIESYWWQIYLVPLLLAVAAYSIVPFDGWLTHPDRHAFVAGDVIRISILSELFAHGFGVFVVAVGIYMLAPKSRVTIPRIVVCAFWPGLVANFLKFQIARVRPIQYFDASSQANFPSDSWATWLGWFYNCDLNRYYAHQSFPSAHAATVWGLAIAMIWAFPRGKYLFIFIASLASIQRVISYAHWPSDVLAGVAVGILCGGALQQNWGLGWLLRRLEEKLFGDRSKISPVTD